MCLSAWVTSLEMWSTCRAFIRAQVLKDNFFWSGRWNAHFPMLMEWKEYISSHLKVAWMQWLPHQTLICVHGGWVCGSRGSQVRCALPPCAVEVTPAHIPKKNSPSPLQPCPHLGLLPSGVPRARLDLQPCPKSNISVTSIGVLILYTQIKILTAALSQIKYLSHIHRCSHLYPLYFINSNFSLINNFQFLIRVSLNEEPFSERWQEWGLGLTPLRSYSREFTAGFSRKTLCRNGVFIRTMILSVL